MKKNLLSILVIAAAAIALLSCNKEAPAPAGEARGELRTVSFHTGAPETKVAFGSISGDKVPTLWTQEDREIAAVVNYNVSSNIYYDFAVKVTPSSDGRSASFEASLADDNTGKYDFTLISPAAAFRYAWSEYGGMVMVNIPVSQTSGTLTPDPDAMVIVASTDTLDAWPGQRLSLQFHHATAYLRVNAQNVATVAGESVNAISISAEEPLSGGIALGFDEGELSGWMPLDGDTDSTLYVNTSNPADTWIGCAPLKAGTVLTVTAGTDKGRSFTTSFTVPADLYSGHIGPVEADFAGVAPEDTPFKYQDWLGTFTIDRDGNNTDTWTIEQDQVNSSYSIVGVEGIDDLPVTASYDPTTGNMSMSSHINFFQFTDEELGDMEISLYGLINMSGKIYFVSGDYSIFTASWKDGGKTAADLAPESVTVSGGSSYTFVGMRFIAKAAGESYYYLGQENEYTHLPRTITRTSSSGAPARSPRLKKSLKPLAPASELRATAE